MNKEIIKRHNEVVRPDDDVYILGDLMLGQDYNAGLDCIGQLNGKLHVIRGNHDSDNRVALYEMSQLFDDAVHDALYLNYKKYHFYLSHYPTLTGNLEKESLKQCTINLFGHTHQTRNFYQDMPFMYHVGVDSHNCYPVNLDDAISEMKAKVEECKEYL